MTARVQRNLTCPFLGVDKPCTLRAGGNDNTIHWFCLEAPCLMILITHTSALRFKFRYVTGNRHCPVKGIKENMG